MVKKTKAGEWVSQECGQSGLLISRDILWSRVLNDYKFSFDSPVDFLITLWSTDLGLIYLGMRTGFLDVKKEDMKYWEIYRISHDNVNGIVEVFTPYGRKKHYVSAVLRVESTNREYQIDIGHPDKNRAIKPLAVMIADLENGGQ